MRDDDFRQYDPKELLANITDEDRLRYAEQFKREDVAFRIFNTLYNDPTATTERLQTLLTEIQDIGLAAFLNDEN